MRNTDLMPRPWSCHRPRHPGFAPLICGEVKWVGGRRRVSWRATVLVNDLPMFTSHLGTRAAAESECARMLQSYTDAHYISK